MKIQTDQELLDGITKILGSVEAKTRERENPQVGAFTTLYNSLIRIQKNVTNGDFTVTSKQDCNMSGPISYLYESDRDIPVLGLALYEINDYYQGAGIKTLSDDEAGVYFLFKR